MTAVGLHLSVRVLASGTPLHQNILVSFNTIRYHLRKHDRPLTQKFH